MIELLDHQLSYRFPEVHEKALCRIDFQRTLRIPDDNREYPLPPGLGRFPVEHVDDFADRLPDSWKTHGGVFIPMYQSEALWIKFSGQYPCAIKVAAGKNNAISGETWQQALCDDPQDYLVVPDQPWLDGFNVSEDHIRQFVAMPLDEGYTAEEQITGQAEHGGLQIIVYPMKAEVYAEQCGQKEESLLAEGVDYYMCCDMPMGMGLAPGGLMRQTIHEDQYGIDAWDQDSGYRCFIHLANSAQYQAITGHPPPHQPVSAEDYTSAGLPWFEYYGDGKAVPGSATLRKLTSVATRVFEIKKDWLPGNEAVQPGVVRVIRQGNLVRNGDF